MSVEVYTGIKARLERVEKHNRWLWIAVCSTLSLLLIISLIISSKWLFSTTYVEADSQGITMYDKDGRLYATFRTQKYDYQDNQQWKVDSEKVVVFYGDQGVPRFSLNIKREAGYIAFSDENLKSKIMLALITSGTREAKMSMIALDDENGRTRVLIALDEEGPSLILCDENSNPRLEFRVGKQGPVIVVKDEKGTIVFSKP